MLYSIFISKKMNNIIFNNYYIYLCKINNIIFIIFNNYYIYLCKIMVIFNPL